MKIVILVLVGLLGCGDGHRGSGGSDGAADSGGGGTGGTDGGAGTGGSDGGGDLCPQPGTICGSAIDTFLTDTGEVQRPRDLSNVSIEAVAFDAAGAPTRYQGTGQADGTYVIPGVPEGTYTLKWWDPDLRGGMVQRYRVTTKHKLDLGLVFYGRPNATLVTTSPTNLVFNVTGMAPWQDGNLLQITAFGAGGFGLAVRYDPNTGMLLSGNPTVGATSLSGFTIDWSLTAPTDFIDQPMLIDGGQADRLALTQLVSRSNASASYLSIVKIFRAPAFTMTSGQPSTLAGAFEDVAQDRQIWASWKRSEFAAHVTEIHPSARAAAPNFTILVQPRADVYTYVSPTLLDVSSTTQPDGTDVDLSLQYGNPFPPAWPSWATSCMYADAYLPYPTGTSRMDMYGFICGSLPLASAQTGTMRPTISPPRDLKVNGIAATGPLVGIGTTPALSWSPPALGTPTSCSVVVRKRPVGAGDYTAISVPATSTSVRIPPGILEPTGFVYAFRVDCGDDLGYASAFTGVMTP